MTDVKTEAEKTDEPKPKLTGLELLRAPFEARHFSLLPKPFKKDAPKSECNICGGYHGQPAAHLEYVGHAALTDRLLESDINWHWEPLAFDADGLPKFDKSGGLWINLTVAGQTRLGYGHAAESQYKEIGAREKEVIGDALRNAGMRFGAALELWHKGDLHELEGENKKKGKKPVEKEKKFTPSPLKDSKDFYVFTTGKFRDKRFDEVLPEDFDAELAKYEAVEVKTVNLKKIIGIMHLFKAESKKTITVKPTTNPMDELDQRIGLKP